MATREEIAMVKKVRTGLTKFFDIICSKFCTDDLVHEIMYLRGYTSQEMFNTIKEMGVFKVKHSTDLLLFSDVTMEDLKIWGICDKDGKFLLSERYVFAIRDISGNVTALVGWDKDGGPKKYLTTSTYGFSRDACFFNLDCYKYSMEKCNGVIYVVEGIFDTIALRSLGFAVIGNMGLEMSKIKSEILTRFKKVIAIHDNDMAGKGTNPMLNGISGKSPRFIWKIQNQFVFVLLPTGVKDIDELIRDYECYDDLVESQNAQYLKRLYIN